jgi:twitching motility protein PilT
VAEIDSHLRRLVELGGSDLHFLAGDPIRVRVNGDLRVLEDKPLEAATAQELLEEILSPAARKALDDHDGADFAHDIPGVGRFRVNILRQLNGMGGIFRAIPSAAKTLQELNMPSVVYSLCKHKNGLILVTGKTGSGKSTTLAAMVDAINRRLKGHIVTIEDPIEFVHPRRNCLISQREVGVHTGSFADALRSALREDPDVILVGELRDLETMSIAVTAAEMGILVMGTLHTNGAAATVDRIVNAFPTDKQGPIRTMLATSLRGVISQQLIPTLDHKGRVAALEVMVNNPAISNLIRQGKMDQLENAIQSGAASGMQVMDGALMHLYKSRKITGDAAYQNSIAKPKFESLKGTGEYGR